MFVSKGIYMNTYEYMYIYICIYIYTHIYTDAFMCVSWRIYVLQYAWDTIESFSQDFNQYVCVYVYIYVYVFLSRLCVNVFVSNMWYTITHKYVQLCVQS